MKRNTYMLLGANLSIIGVIVALMAFTLINERFIVLIGVTTALLGLVLVGIGAEKRKYKQDYLLWALEYYRQQIHKMKEHLGLQQANVFFVPSSKCSGRPCMIKTLEEKIERIPEGNQLIIPIGNSYGIKIYPVKGTIVPERSEGVLSGENALSTLLVGQYTVVQGIDVTETDKNIVVTLHKPDIKEYGEDLIEELIFLTGIIISEATDTTIFLSSLEKEKDSLSITFEKSVI